MFTSLYLKNFKSLKNFKVNFLQKRKEPKKAIIVYGENGVGKSNFASAFYTLCESMQTMAVKKAIQNILEKNDSEPEFRNEFLLKVISKNISDTDSIIRTCKTINSHENMVLEFGFNIGGRDGKYLLEYDDTKIVHERLDYALNVNRTLVYDISTDNTKINSNLFWDKDYEREIRELIEKYKGKHSFLAILVNEKEEKAEEYYESRIHERLYEVIAEFMTMSIKVKKGNRGESGKRGVHHEILNELDKGEIFRFEEQELDKAEELLNEFYTHMYSDIKQVFYKREYEEEKIKYELMFKKLIYGEIIDVNYALESTGTLHLLDILPFLLMSIKGTTVVIDEIDAGIHDILINNILSNIIPAIKGQLIITTHNTMLLDSDISPEYIYTFMVDKDANKQLESIDKFEDRLHPNLNYRNRYLKGMYGGVPICGDVDFEELNEIFD
ncbi:MAG: ATP/GTP-binding protein [Anaerovoracaceae bacterium]